MRNPSDTETSQYIELYYGKTRTDECSLYPAPHRMEEDGWIRAEWVTKDTGRRARIYELTVAGKKQLADEESRWRVVTSAVNRVLRTV